MNTQICYNGMLSDDIKVHGQWSQTGVLNGSHTFQTVCMSGGGEMDRENEGCRESLNLPEYVMPNFLRAFRKPSFGT